MDTKKSLSRMVVWTGIILLYVILILLDPEVAGGLLTTAMWGLIGLIGVYLGIDLGAVIKKTKALPPGSFCLSDKWKYLRMIGALLVVILILLVQYQVFEMNTITTLQIAVPGFFALAGIYVGGMKLNKAATGVKVDVK